jgi:putative ABC transport system permease protein
MRGLFKLALRNVVRQKMHTAMTLGAIVFGVAGLVLAGGWVNDIFLQLGEALIHSQSGHAQLYKQGYFAAGSRSPEKYLIGNPDEVKERIRRIPGIEDTMARINFSGLLNTGRSDLPIIGEGGEPDLEAKLGTSVQFTEGRQLTDKDAFGIVIGYGVAKSLKLKVGDRVTILANALEGALNSLDFEIVGIFQSFSADYDARAVRIPLDAAKELLGTKDANTIVVTLKNTADTDRLTNLLKTEFSQQGLEVKTWIELNDFYEKTVELYRRQFGFLQLIILIMVLLSVTNSVNMSVFERVGEFGTMKALGNRGQYVFGLIVTESLILGCVGGLLGVCVGMVLALVISSIGIPMPPLPNANISYIARVQIIPIWIFGAFVVGFIATVLASILPGRRVSRIDVVEALKHNI